MSEALVCDGVRTPIGRYGGALAMVRPDDMAAGVIRHLLIRNPELNPGAIDDVMMGCANQAGEDNRNVARMAALLAGLPDSVPGLTVNRLCASGLDAVVTAAHGIKSGDRDLCIAGGVESMSRAPMVMPKANRAFARNPEIHDTTLGWRFINPQMHAAYGTDSMLETAENVARDFVISRERQDTFALRSQHLAADAIGRGRMAQEITPVTKEGNGGQSVVVDHDEHPRKNVTIEQLSNLSPLIHPSGTVTAGNASGINDGAAALLIASPAQAEAQGLRPMARVVASASVGVEPRIMGFGPAPAIRKLLSKTGVSIDDVGVIEINEAFASQVLASLHELGIDDDDTRVNPNGGAIALGHPLGMSGARLVLAAALEMQSRGVRYALCAMCVGVGQGVALLLEAM